jgi:leucyl aminopeptidase
MARLVDERPQTTIPVWFVTEENWPSIRDGLPEETRAFAIAMGFAPKPGRHVVAPRRDGSISAVLLGVEAMKPGEGPTMVTGKLATVLPEGFYEFADAPPEGAEQAALAWLLSSYAFDRYRSSGGKTFPQLVAPAKIDVRKTNMLAESVCFGRDLINIPACEMGPVALEKAAQALAAEHGAVTQSIVGEQLAEQNFPLILTVGRAAAEEPRLVDMRWGDPNAPKVTVVGKGVCFDSGGLDIKPSSAMSLMKKDMAGAATALALGRMIMQAGLPIRLRILLPIVENAIASRSFRPGDIYPSRKGLFVEIGNTDAEGRLILADALAFAEEDEPDLMFDFATLTGAARVALGPDLPPFYSRDDGLAAAISSSATAVDDPVWRMPLWAPYARLLESKVADMNNISSSPFAGSIIAALFLARFVAPARSWAHFDIYGWNPSTKPGRPEGGEIQTARLLFDLLETRFRA